MLEKAIHGLVGIACLALLIGGPACKSGSDAPPAGQAESPTETAETPPPPPLTPEARWFAAAPSPVLSATLAHHLPTDTALMVASPTLASLGEAAGALTDDHRSGLTEQLQALTGLDLLDPTALTGAGVRADGPVALALLQPSWDSAVLLLTISDEARLRQAVGERPLLVRGEVALLAMTTARDALEPLEKLEPTASLGARPEFTKLAQEMRHGSHVAAYLAPRRFLQSAHDEQLEQLQKLEKRPAAARLSKYEKKKKQRKSRLRELREDAEREVRYLTKLRRPVKLYREVVQPLTAVAVGITVSSEAISATAVATLADDQGRWATATDAPPMPATAKPPLMALSTSLGVDGLDLAAELASWRAPLHDVLRSLAALGIDVREQPDLFGADGAIVVSSVGRPLSLSVALRDSADLGQRLSAAPVEPGNAKRSANGELQVDADGWLTTPYDQFKVVADKLEYRDPRADAAPTAAALTAIKDPRVADILGLPGALRLVLDGQFYSRRRATQIRGSMGILAAMSMCGSGSFGLLAMGKPTKKTKKKQKECDAVNAELDELREAARPHEQSADKAMREGMGSTVAIARREGDVVRVYAVQLASENTRATGRTLASWWYSHSDVNPRNAEMAKLETRIHELSEEIRSSYKYENIFGSSSADLSGLWGDEIGEMKGGFGFGAGGLGGAGGGGTGWGTIGTGSYGTIGHGSGGGAGYGVGRLGRGGTGNKGSTGGTATSGGLGIRGRGAGKKSSSERVSLARVSDDRLRRHGRSKLGAVKRCHSKSADRPSGMVTVTVQADADGAIKQATASGAGDGAFHRCVSAAVRGSLGKAPGQIFHGSISYRLSAEK